VIFFKVGFYVYINWAILLIVVINLEHIVYILFLSRQVSELAQCFLHWHELGTFHVLVLLRLVSNCVEVMVVLNEHLKADELDFLETVILPERSLVYNGRHIDELMYRALLLISERKLPFFLIVAFISILLTCFHFVQHLLKLDFIGLPRLLFARRRLLAAIIFLFVKVTLVLAFFLFLRPFLAFLFWFG